MAEVIVTTKDERAGWRTVYRIPVSSTKYLLYVHADTYSYRESLLLEHQNPCMLHFHVKNLDKWLQIESETHEPLLSTPIPIRSGPDSEPK